MTHSHVLKTRWDSAIKQETQDKPVLLSLTPEVAPYLNIFNNRNFTSREIEDNFIVAKVVRFQAIVGAKRLLEE